MITIENLIKFIVELCGMKFYGNIIIRFESGTIKHIEKTEKLIKLV